MNQMRGAPDLPPVAITATIDRLSDDVTSTTTQSFALHYRVTAKGDSLFYYRDDQGDYACPRLTEEAFVVAYNQAIQSRSDDLDSSVDQVTSVVEMEELACTGDTDTFLPDVIVTFVGNPGLSTPQQLDALAESFGQMYNAINRLNPDTCDRFFRSIADATVIEEDGFNRRLEQEATVAEQRRFLQTGTVFSFLYRIVGRCRGGCSSSSPLFDHESGSRQRELLSLALLASDEQSKWRRLQDGDCTCPVGATEQRAPTEEEFQAAYQSAIASLQQQSLIDGAFIESVVDVREVDQVECGAMETFETRVVVELSGRS